MNATILHRPSTGAGRRDQISVTIHDIRPQCFERVALVCDWLADQGIERTTLLVVPAPDLHPVNHLSDGLVEWLSEQRNAGACVAQLGLCNVDRSHHSRTRLWHRAGLRSSAAEFANLDPAETKRALGAGRRILHLADLEPEGFVAPGYGYTAALHQSLASRFKWWISESRLHTPLTGARGAAMPRAVSAKNIRRWSARAAQESPLLRVDLHPSDLDDSRAVDSFERLFDRAHERRAVSFGELAAAAAVSA